LFLSVFDIYKVGIGPSSSHTVGPIVAAGRFLEMVRAHPRIDEITRLRVFLHGSLAFTGKGHGSDRAVVLGLLGQIPETLDPDAVEGLIEGVETGKSITLEGIGDIAFDPTQDIVFDFEKSLPGHANAMNFVALADDGAIIEEQVFYSIGGGFVVNETELEDYQNQDSEVDFTGVPYPFHNAVEMLAMGNETGHSIAEMKRANELVSRDGSALDEGLDDLWHVMNSSIDRGMACEGKLPGGLDVKRRAKFISDNLNNDRSNEKFAHTVMDWISVYAMAVNEENAAGGRIVTAPTNGAAGIIPAVIRYYLDFCPSACVRGIREFLLVSSAIGGLIKHNASISGAEVGCQGEVGSASAMAAAGLAAVLGGSNEQVENAAEIALEHHLGMTCDPIGGLVQVPCIERNALGAVKAISAASLALRGDGTHFVPLDSAIKTMRETGHDMLTKYKETSQGGLAVNVTEC
jgi:L-serine dehydratase